jgi:polysaccharide biosynthesis/export protein
MKVLSRSLLPFAAGLLLALPAAGCAHDRELLREALLRSAPAPSPVAEYPVACPDIIRVSVAGRPEVSGATEVQANGCVALGSLGGVRVAGMTSSDIEKEIAAAVGVAPHGVRVDVERCLSRQVYVFGEVNGQQRAVHYEGPERIVDLLRRTGGVTPESAPEEVRILRNPDLANPEAETIRVDLRAILLEGDDRTNVVVQPYDQIYVGESKGARVGRCLHPWLRPLCKWMSGS